MCPSGAAYEGVPFSLFYSSHAYAGPVCGRYNIDAIVCGETHGSASDPGGVRNKALLSYMTGGMTHRTQVDILVNSV